MDKIFIHPYLYPAFPIYSKTHNPKVKVSRIIPIACKLMNVTQKEFHSKSRIAKIVRARFMVAYFLKTDQKMTLIEIGKEIGLKDHSSVKHAVESFENDLTFNTETKKKFEEFSFQLKLQSYSYNN